MKKITKKTFSEEHKRRLKEAWKIRKLIPISENTRKKLSDAMVKRRKENPKLGVQLGIKNGMYGSARFGRKNPMWGRKHSAKAKEIIRIKAIGRKASDETRKNMSGRIPWNKDKPFLAKEKNPNWNGGSSKFPYNFGFDERLKEFIRERDNHTCRNCQREWKKEEKAFPVHHIFYDKKDIEPNHLITLCSLCHNKSNALKNRKYFIEKFSKLMCINF